MTADDKAAIKAMSLEAGLDVKFTSRCKNCYLDALVLLRMKYCVAVSDGDMLLTPSGNYYWTRGAKKTIWWRKGYKLTLSAQSDDETIEAYISAFPAQKEFERVDVGGNGESVATGENECKNSGNPEGGAQ